MYLIYDFLFLIYMAAYFPLMILRGKWHDGFNERFGQLSFEQRTLLSVRKNIWLHAVSVGEVMAIEGLLKRLRQEYSSCTIVLSVTTKAGHDLALKKFSDTAIILWAPLDLSWVVNAFVKFVHPIVYIAVETELWPNLFRRLSEDRIPILVVNGRISDKAYRKYIFVKALLKSTLSRVRLFCMQSALDAERIVELGAPAKNVKIAGNIKFDAALPPPNFAGTRRFFFDHETVFVAGSTHPGEEEILLDVFQALLMRDASVRLILAPRHPERAGDVSALVKARGFQPILFSSINAGILANGIVILDTIGHLQSFYAQADLVFVGKSLTIQGGHNIIEPAVHAKAVLIGPHMQNFRDITKAFLEKKAVIQVGSLEELKTTCLDLLKAPDRRAELGRKAREVIAQNQGATERTIDIIKETLL